MDLRILMGVALLATGAVVVLLRDLAPNAAFAAGPRSQDPAPTDLAPDPLAQPPAPQEQRASASLPLVIEIYADADGFEYATVVGSSVPVSSVLRKIAERTGRILYGYEEHALASPLITVELRDRPLDEVLEYMLGAADMRVELTPGVLLVSKDEVAGDEQALLQRALVGYSRCGLKDTDGLNAAAARLAQGEIEALRGNDDAALQHYQLLVEAYPTSALVLEAHFRSGLVLQRLGMWPQAVDEFRRVTDLSAEAIVDGSNPVRPFERYAPAAQLEIARCNLELGHAEWALLIINVLDRKYDPIDRAEVVERGLLRARAYERGRAWVECLRVLNDLERGFMPPAASVAGIELRARCFEGLDLGKEAARAWLIHARQVQDPERARSYERASELFLSRKDHTGVLFVAFEAKSRNSSADVAAAERISRAALGLPVELNADNSSVQERVAAALHAAEQGKWNEVELLLGPLAAELELVPTEQRVLVAQTWARQRFAVGGIEMALAVLRVAREVIAVTQPEDLTKLDLYAAQLLEQERLFERALAAYDGNY